MAPHFIPSREYIESIQVGDTTLDFMGDIATVISIHARGTNIKGYAFICMYTQTESQKERGCSVSFSMTERQLIPYVPLCCFYPTYWAMHGEEQRMLAWSKLPERQAPSEEEFWAKRKQDEIPTSTYGNGVSP